MLREGRLGTKEPSVIGFMKSFTFRMKKKNILVTPSPRVITIGAFIGCNDIKLLKFKIAGTKVQ